MLLPVLALCSCASSSNSGSNSSVGPCHGPGCTSGSAGSANVIPTSDASTPVIIDVTNPVSDAGATWSGLCGPQTDSCRPGSELVCTEAPGDAGPRWGVADESSDSGARSLDAGVDSTCRVLRASDGVNVQLSCESAGASPPGAACIATTDCAAGSTCVWDVTAPVCRQYCCELPDGCPASSYCSTRMTYMSGGQNSKYQAGPEVPVCIPADNCNLSDPFPCPEGQSCTCKNGDACMVIGTGGLTTCRKPGTGKQNDSCYGNLCSAGYVCVSATAKCLKLCKVERASSLTATSDCPSGTSCQASLDIPSGWGVCSDTPLILN